jgi:hypothetical protein
VGVFLGIPGGETQTLVRIKKFIKNFSKNFIYSDNPTSPDAAMPEIQVVKRAKRGPSSKGKVPAHYAHNKLDEKLPRAKGFMEQHLIEPRPVTESQLVVIQAIARGETPYAASKIAGVNPAYTYAFLKRPYIQDMVAVERKKFEEASQMSRKQVMDGLLESIQMAKMMSEPASMISGWREIGKMCGYYEPVKVRLDVNVSGNVVMQKMASLTDAELLKLIQEGPSALESLPAPN